jgi:uncharacterized protein with HEPN domain
MNENRVPDYLDHMIEAAQLACSYVENLSQEDFLLDKRTQQAVIMNLIVIGEAATKIMEADPAFTNTQSDIPWRSMRGMRNRIAHGYFDINLEVVWDTVQTALPTLLAKLPVAKQAAISANPKLS